MQWQLEGPILEDLLLEVEDTYAGKAVIVGAEKVRRGGFGGFFAREHFELRVETSMDAEATAPDAGPLSILELAEEMSDRESGPGRETAISTENSNFSHVLSRLQGLTRPIEEPDLSLGVSVAAILERSVTTTSPMSELATPSATGPAILPWHPIRLESLSAPVTKPAPAALPSAAQTPARTSPARTSPAHAALRRLGVPARLLAGIDSDADVEDAISSVCGKLGTAAPVTLKAGEVLVVIGGADTCLEAARACARVLTVPTAGVRLAAEHSTNAVPRLASPEAVFRQRGVWAGLDHGTILAVDAISGMQEHWSKTVLAAADATMTWLCVPATMKPRDARALVNLVNPAGLIVTGHGNSADPGTVLDLGVPVVMLGSEAACPAVWQRVLHDRMGQDG